MSTHSKLSPSHSATWVKCTASIRYCEERGLVSKDSAASQEGTVAHSYAEKLLKGTITAEEIPEDMQPHIVAYKEECMSASPEGSDFYVELKEPLPYMKNRVGSDDVSTGTCDFVAVTKEKIVIRDLKYGVGVIVDAEYNTQLAIYAWSFVEAYKLFYDFDNSTIIDVGIFQPRTREDNPLKTWELTIGELYMFCRPIQEAADDILSGDPSRERFYISEKVCRWCPARYACEFKNNSILDKLPTELDPRISKIPSTLKSIDYATIVAVFKNSKNLKSLIESAHKVAYEKAMSGEPLDGTKLILGKKGDRKYTDEDAADKFLMSFLTEEERYEKNLLSPAKAEKVLKDELKDEEIRSDFDSLISRADAKPTVVLADNKSPAINPQDYASVFDDLSEEDENE